MIVDDLLDFEWLPGLPSGLEDLDPDSLPPQIDLQPDPDATPPDLAGLHPALTDALSSELPGDDDPFLDLDHAEIGPSALREALAGLQIVNPF